MAAKSFKFFASFLEAAELLPEKDRGIFLYAVAKYGIEGVEVPLKKSLQSHWALVKPNLDISRKYQSNGEKGGRPKKPPLEKSESPLSDFEKPDKDKNKDKNKDMDRNEDGDKPTAAAAATAPPNGALGGSPLLGIVVGQDFAQPDEDTERARNEFFANLNQRPFVLADAAPADAFPMDAETEVEDV